jgi:hypothetical protein
VRHAGYYGPADHAALELGNQPEHLKHRPPSRRAGVEALLMQIEVDLLGVELAQEAQQIDQAASQPVHCPCRHHVHLAPRNGAQQRLRRRPALVRKATADALVVDSPKMGLNPAEIRAPKARFRQGFLGQLPSITGSVRAEGEVTYGT